MILARRSLLAGAATLAALPYHAVAQGPRVLRNSIALDENRVWISARIGASGPYYFIIDTGATMSLLKDDLARQLKLPIIRRRSVIAGVGGVSDLPLYDGGVVSFASGLKIPAMPFNGIATNGLGRDAVGSFGAGLFTSFDSDLDFVKGEWRGYPDGRPDFTGLRQLKSRFSGDIVRGDRIFADASVGSFTGSFLIDTGAPGVIRLDGRASKASGLWDDTRPYAPAQSRGIGRATVATRVVRTDTLKLGPMTLHRPLVSLAEPGSPSHEGDGIIGIRVLERLHLTTQVKSRTLWIAPNGRPARPDGYAMSGLLVERRGDGMFIADVGTGSPAAAAALKAGDRIDGIAWDALQAGVYGAAGSELRFAVERGGTKRDVVLKLADYL